MCRSVTSSLFLTLACLLAVLSIKVRDGADSVCDVALCPLQGESHECVPTVFPGPPASPSKETEKMRSGVGFECVPEAPPYNLSPPAPGNVGFAFRALGTRGFRCQAHSAGPGAAQTCACVMPSSLRDPGACLSHSTRLPLWVLAAPARLSSPFCHKQSKRRDVSTHQRPGQGRGGHQLGPT